MILYTYDIDTGEYTGQINAQKRPNGDYITDVLGATTSIPPKNTDGYTVVWTDTAWSLVEDHRPKYDARGVKSGGTAYWLDSDTHETQARYMTALGPLPDGALLEQPAKPVPTTDELAASLRTERDKRITACDWVMARHAEQVALDMETTLDAVQYAAWLTYRQTLRDMPLQDGFPWDGGGDVTPWPVIPSELLE